MIGQTLAHYRIEEKLGEGGMGVAYRARDTRLQRDVALKLLSVASATPEARERLLAEARAASALNHPNVAAIHEVSEHEGHSFIVMELVPGRALSRQIPPEGLPVETCLRYGAQIAAALAHAHERGVLHRDLKSANVVVTPEGQAKVLDFGLAARVSTELNEATRSLAALDPSKPVAGTLHYMAPEVLRGEAADTRSDIWALGVVLYEMAAGKLPFEGRTGFELSSAILRESLPPFPTAVPAGLRGVIQRCLAKDAGHRYQGAAQVHAALEALQSDTTLLLKEPKGSAPPRPWWKWKWVWAVALPIVLGLAVWKGPFILSIGKTELKETGPRLSSGGKPSKVPEANEYFEKAMLFLKGQFDLQRGRQMLERALELDPKFAEARAWYGFTYVLLLDSGASNDGAWLYKAEEELRVALRDDPNCARVHSSLAGVYFYQGRQDLVREEAEKALRADPIDIDAKNWLGMHFQMLGEDDKARAWWTNVLQQDPLFFPSRWNLADLARTQGDYSEAKRQAQKMLEQDPRNAIALRLLAVIAIDEGNLAGARSWLARVPPEEKQNYLVRLAWALLYAREGQAELARKEMDENLLKFGEANKNATIEVAEFFALRGDTERACEWLERAVQGVDERVEWFQRDPLLANIRNHPRFKQILDSVAYRRPRPAGAESRPAAQRLSSGGKASGNAEANEYFEKGRSILLSQNDVPRAQQMYRRALELDPKFAEARAEYGFTYFLLVDTGYVSDPSMLYKAQEELQHALRDDPGCARAHSALAAVYMMQGRKELVPAEAEKALQLNPDDLDARTWLMHYHNQNGDTAAAIALARENLKRNPLFWPSRMNLGEFLRQQGDIAGALREQGKVLEQEPQHVYALRNVARTYMDAGDLLRARAALERARPADRSNSNLRKAWAILYALEGKKDLARKEMDAELQKSVEASGDALFAAEFHAVLGEKDKAVEWLDRLMRGGDERAEWFRRDPLLASIRNHPRFKQVLNSVAFRRQQRSR